MTDAKWQVLGYALLIVLFVLKWLRDERGTRKVSAKLDTAQEIVATKAEETKNAVIQSVEANTKITERGVDKADSAYREANSFNMKLAKMDARVERIERCVELLTANQQGRPIKHARKRTK